MASKYDLAILVAPSIHPLVLTRIDGSGNDDASGVAFDADGKVVVFGQYSLSPVSIDQSGMLYCANMISGDFLFLATCCIACLLW